MKQNNEYQDDYEDPYNDEVYENYNSENEYTTYDEIHQKNRKMHRIRWKNAQKVWLLDWAY